QRRSGAVHRCDSRPVFRVGFLAAEGERRAGSYSLCSLSERLRELIKPCRKQFASPSGHRVPLITTQIPPPSAPPRTPRRDKPPANKTTKKFPDRAYR